MLKFQMIGYLGRDAIVQQHGTDNVINFSLCHTDKWKDATGKQYERATWVSCSYWSESVKVAEYMKKGTLIWAEGIPESKHYTKNGETKSYLNMRVARIELLGGKREENQNQQQSIPSSDNQQPGFQAVNTGDDDLPF